MVEQLGFYGFGMISGVYISLVVMIIIGVRIITANTRAMETYRDHHERLYKILTNSISPVEETDDRD